MSNYLVRRLRDTPNWMREGRQKWKDNVKTYDRAPFEAADRIESDAARIRKLEADAARIRKLEADAARIRELEAKVERLRNPPEDHCAKCGAPRSNHPYRHPFVPRALSETEGE